jgi:hypothetical protein
MLEFAKILRDIDDFGRERAESITGLDEQFARASTVMSDICADLHRARSRISAAQTSWLLAGFVEPPDTTIPCPQYPSPHAVAAVDGSQIAPDRHEAASCFLLNASSIVIYYGSTHRPEYRTAPKLCYREEDIFEEYNKRKTPVTDKLLGMRRTLAESDELLYAIETAAGKGIP